MTARGAKRIRIRMRAHDPIGLARSFKSHVSRRGLFIKSEQQLPPGTHVIVELLYANGTRALYGEGRVAWQHAEGTPFLPGMNLELDWDAPSLGVIDQVLRTPSVPPDERRPDAMRRPPSFVDSVFGPTLSSVARHAAESSGDRSDPSDDSIRTEVADVSSALKELEIHGASGAQEPASESGIRAALKDPVGPAEVREAPAGGFIEHMEPVTTLLSPARGDSPVRRRESSSRGKNEAPSRPEIWIRDGQLADAMADSGANDGRRPMDFASAFVAEPGPSASMPPITSADLMARASEGPPETKEEPTTTHAHPLEADVGGTDADLPMERTAAMAEAPSVDELSGSDPRGLWGWVKRVLKPRP